MAHQLAIVENCRSILFDRALGSSMLILTSINSKYILFNTTAGDIVAWILTKKQNAVMYVCGVST